VRFLPAKLIENTRQLSHHRNGEANEVEIKKEYPPLAADMAAPALSCEEAKYH